MVYMGSKSRYAKYIVPILQKIIDTNHIENYIEPFVGGANIIDKIKCKNRYGSDLSESLIALLCAAQNNIEDIPICGSREMWDLAKKNSPELTLVERGAIEWFSSYNGRGFPGGYISNTDRNYYDERYRNLSAQAKSLKGIEFLCLDYTSLIENVDNALIYCDPPYFGTKAYGINTKFDHSTFWNWAKEKSKHSIVLVSEETIPLNKSEYNILWEKEVKRTMLGSETTLRTEKLIIIKGDHK